MSGVDPSELGPAPQSSSDVEPSVRRLGSRILGVLDAGGTLVGAGLVFAQFPAAANVFAAGGDVVDGLALAGAAAAVIPQAIKGRLPDNDDPRGLGLTAAVVAFALHGYAVSTLAKASAENLAHHNPVGAAVLGAAALWAARDTFDAVRDALKAQSQPQSVS